MSKFKIGQLAMLVKTGENAIKYGVPVGAVGEITGMSIAHEEEYCIKFPRNPPPAPYETWAADADHLIPINDPDIDVSEHEFKPLEELI